MSMQELLTTEQAGAVLKLLPESLTRMIRRGDIPAVKIGKRWLIRKETLDAMLEPSTPAPQG